MRRFLQHILPPGLMRVRHFGFLANRCRRAKLAQIRQQLAVSEAAPETSSTDTAIEPTYPCPACRQGRLRIIARLPRFDDDERVLIEHQAVPGRPPHRGRGLRARPRLDLGIRWR